MHRFFSVIFEQKTSHNSQLKSILDFLYNGEVNVAQDELDEFLYAATDMNLMGLELKTESFEEKVIKNSTIRNESAKKFPDDINEVYENRTENYEKNNILTTSNSVIVEMEDFLLDYSDSYEQLMENQDLKSRIEQIIEKYEFGKWKCKVCERISRNKSHAKDHAEVHIEGVEHNCQFCKKVFHTSPSLRAHVNTYHKNTKTRQ